jgi:hypothetical protein
MAAAKKASPAARNIASSIGTSVSGGPVYEVRPIDSMGIGRSGNIGGIYEAMSHHTVV